MLKIKKNRTRKRLLLVATLLLAISAGGVIAIFLGILPLPHSKLKNSDDYGKRMTTFKLLENRGNDISEQLINAIDITLPSEILLRPFKQGGITYAIGFFIAKHNVKANANLSSKFKEKHLEDKDYQMTVVLESRASRLPASGKIDELRNNDMASLYFDIKVK